MPVRRILVGQLWKSVDTGDVYLVTKIYSEALASYAMLRKTGSETEAVAKVKIQRSGETQGLPGYVYAQESESF
jgi:hypothetical protein